MDFNISENSTDTRYFLTVEFTQPILPFLTNGTFNISIKDMLTMTTINIDSLDVLLNQYGLTVPYRTSIQDQLDNSLINNKGIVITIPNENIISFTMIPRCVEINTNKIIGFYDSMINIHAELNDVTVDVNTTAKLYPRLVRSDTLDKYAPEPDPVLPPEVDRCCYTYPDIYQDSTKKITHNVVYNTDSEFYANSTTSANTPPEEVPSYVSKLSAYFTAEEADGFVPAWNNVVSWLYNDRNKSHVDVDWECLDTERPSVYTTYVVGNSTDTEIPEIYWLTVSAYQINQYVFAKNLPPNRYENKLFFGLSAEHIDIYPPLEPVHELYAPDTLTITPINPTYILTGDTAQIETPCPTRLLEIDDYSEPPFEQRGIEHFEINFDPNNNGRNAFLYDGHYTNKINYNLNVQYFDANNNRIPSYPIDTPYPETIVSVPINSSTLTISDIKELSPIMLNNSIVDHAVVSARITDIDLDNALLTVDSETDKAPIELAPYWIRKEYAENIRNWFEVNSVQTIWTKYVHPEPSIEYRAPAQINMNILPQYASVNNPSWTNSPNRILNVNANTPDDIEFGRELLTITINPSNLNNFIARATDRLDVTYYVNYPGSHRSEDVTLSTTFGTEPVPETETFTVPADRSEPLTANINLSGELDEDATITIAAELVLYDPNGTREQEIKDRYHVDLSMLPDWNKIPAVTLNWTRRYTEPFIPDPWDAFSNYVIFTKSPLTIKDSYIGVKSIYAPCLFARNAIVESEVFIDGDRHVGDYETCLSMDNLNTTTHIWSDGTNKQKYNPESQTIQPTHQVGGSLYMGVSTPLTTNIKILRNGDYQGIQNVNDSALANDSIDGLYATFEKSPNLESLNAEFTGTRDIYVDAGQIYDFNASVASQFRSIQIMNNVTLRFKKGTYYFKNFHAETNLSIIIDTLAEDEYVRIYVENDCFISNLSNIVNPNTHMLSFMIYSQNGNISLEAASQNLDNYGVLVAPNGTVEFRNGIIWTGAVWANNVLLESSSEVHSFGS